MIKFILFCCALLFGLSIALFVLILIVSTIDALF
jgi:hypothetical protein